MLRLLFAAGLAVLSGAPGCWTTDITWLRCCSPEHGPSGSPDCWDSGRGYSYDDCCHTSPEVDPMVSDLALCANDPALRTEYLRLAHGDVGRRTDCYSIVGCRPSPQGGWVRVFESPATCADEDHDPPELFGEEFTNWACSTLKPLPESDWYDAEAFDRIRFRYRFGTAERAHCAVPNYRFLLEEPLRFYFLLNAQTSTTRVLVNIGAGDAGLDDPLSGILANFANNSTPWRGVFFEAIPENCVQATGRLQALSNIRLECGYVTPDAVVSTLCKELGSDKEAPCKKRLIGEGDRAVRIEVDAMSIDIDSYDCAVLREALLVVSPKLLVVEHLAYPPPIAVSAEFHPSFQSAEKFNMSGVAAMSGSTARGDGFWNGCSLSAVISLLWPFGLGLYRLAARDAMFIRADAADDARLVNETGGWRPADEFVCWRHVCANAGLPDNLIGLVSKGVYSHLAPRIWEAVQEKAQNPVSFGVATPPMSADLPRPFTFVSAASDLSARNTLAMSY